MKRLNLLQLCLLCGTAAIVAACVHGDEELAGHGGFPPTPATAKAPPPTADALTELNYLFEMKSIDSGFGESWERADLLLADPRPGDDDWVKSLQTETLFWTFLAKKARGMNAPAKYAEVHALRLQFLQELDEAGQLLTAAIQHGDLATFEQALLDLKSSFDTFEAGTDALRRVAEAGNVGLPLDTQSAPTSSPPSDALTESPGSRLPTPAQGGSPQLDSFYVQFLAERGLRLWRRETADMTGLGAPQTILDAIGEGCVSCHQHWVFVFQDDRVLSELTGDDPVLLVDVENHGFWLSNAVRVPEEPYCCPSQYESQFYVWDGLHFAKGMSFRCATSQATSAGSCRPQ